MSVVSQPENRLRTGSTPSRSMVRTALRVGFVVVAIVLGTAAVVTRRHQVADALHRVDPWQLALSGLCVPPALHATMLSWRTVLADLGSPLPLRPAARIFYVSQLGKYLPGSVWPVVAQMEMGREYAVPRRRSAMAMMVVFAVNVCSALLVAAVALPLVSGTVITAYWWVWLAVPVLVVAVQPPVLSWSLARVARLVRREPPTETLSLPGLYRTLGWCGVSWVFFGLHLGLVVRGLGATGLTVWPLAIGSFALAWAAGFLVVFVPAGAGVREAVLVLSFASVLPAGVAILAAIVSRLLVTCGDLLLAGLGVLLSRRRSTVRLQVGDVDLAEMGRDTSG